MNRHSILRFTQPILVAVALFSLNSCQHRSASAASFFPDSNEVAGWTRGAEIRTFAPDRLSDYIDGDAEKYIKAGVRTTSTADYNFQNQTEVVVDVYTMSSPDGAKAIFDCEPAGDAKTPAFADAARLFTQSLTFRQGPYFVRMVAYQDSPQISQAMLNLGLAMDKKLSH